VSIEDVFALIERVPTLRALGRAALRILAIGAESRYLHQGEVLFKAGEPSDCGYVVQEGSFRLESKFDSGEEVVAGPGTLLGELALLAGTKRPATAIAREPSTVIRISRSLFLKTLEGYPEAAAILRQQILARAQQSLKELHDVRALLDTSKAPR
jgi:CRP-like cAMP-binding protein